MQQKIFECRIPFFAQIPKKTRIKLNHFYIYFPDKQESSEAVYIGRDIGVRKINIRFRRCHDIGVR